MIPRFPHAIDNSMRKELVKCQTIAKWKFEQGLQELVSNVHKHAGGAYAKGMEVMRKAFYEQGLSPADALKLGIAALHKAYGGFPCPPKESKTAERMAGALAYYADKCPLDKELLVPIRLKNGKLAIEVSFEYPIGISHPDDGGELTYCGRYDELARDPQDGAWVVDEKTTSQMGANWANQWPLDSQMTTYCWSAQRMLAENGIDLEVKGAIINGMAIRAMSNALPYEQARFQTYRDQWEIDRWFDQMRRDIEGWKVAYVKQDHNQVLDHTCALYTHPCEYAPLCRSRNPERIVEGSYKVAFWNPLTREEEQ